MYRKRDLVMSKKVAYSLVTFASLTIAGVSFVLLTSTMTGTISSFRIIFTIILFYSFLNAISIKMQNIIAAYNSILLTRFYLLDKVIRFISTIILISVLLYIGQNVKTIIFSFVCYIIAMSIEILYFIEVDKKKKLENA